MAGELETYVYPHFGALPVSAVKTEHVLKAINPIWREKPETATRVRGRIEAILNWARVHGLREGENPAQRRGHLDQLLPATSKVRRVEHHAALPYKDVPKWTFGKAQGTQLGASRLAEPCICAPRV